MRRRIFFMGDKSGMNVRRQVRVKSPDFRSALLPMPKSVLGEAKDIKKASAETEENPFPSGIAEPHPIFDGSKIVKVGRKNGENPFSRDVCRTDPVSAIKERNERLFIHRGGLSGGINVKESGNPIAEAKRKF